MGSVLLERHEWIRTKFGWPSSQRWGPSLSGSTMESSLDETAVEGHKHDRQAGYVGPATIPLPRSDRTSHTHLYLSHTSGTIHRCTNVKTHSPLTPLCYNSHMQRFLLDRVAQVVHRLVGLRLERIRSISPEASTVMNPIKPSMISCQIPGCCPYRPTPSLPSPSVPNFRATLATSAESIVVEIL